MTRSALAAALFTLVAAQARASAPFDFDKAPGRLPKTVVPVDYRVWIVPDVATKTLRGAETVAVRVRTPVRTIAFNSLNERLHDVRFDGVPVAAVKSDDAAQLTTVTLARAAVTGMHTLAFAYDGKIESSAQGLFAQPYRAPGGATGTMLSTQFEATDARRMFPCWDEPAFRATFQLIATVPAAWTNVSNMPPVSRVVRGALATTTFARSPRMPSYLVEYSAGDLAHLEAASGGRRFGVWSVRGQQQQGATALANAQRILADYDAYFGYRYPLPKLDSIAVPGGFQGAMENWGAITYNDQALLVPADAPLSRKQRVFSIQAHEMAHQWNGDLVTMGWWDDIWLNESFATWMAAKETELRNPTWKWSERQDAAKETAMAADARLTSHPIEQHVVNELDADASFDSAITYDKGQAVLRMLEAYLGPDTFRNGIRRYIKARAFSNATSGDLWNALGAASGRDVGAIASQWTTQAGFPLVTARASCDAAGHRSVTLTQQRFLLAGSDPKRPRWSIPLDVRSGAGAVRTVLFTTDGQTVRAGRCGEPLSLNARDRGFYRVAYDDATLEANRKSFASLPDSDKIALLDDRWALVQAGAAPLASYLSLASAMGSDLDARAWSQIAEALGTIESDERGNAGHDAFTAYARGVLRPVFDRLGWDAKAGEDPTTGDLRRTVIADLGAWGDRDVVAGANARFAALAAGRSSVDLDQRAVILPIVAAYADQATFDRLHAMAKASRDESEARVDYGALVDARDPKLLQQGLEILISPELPPQTAPIRNRLVLGAAGYHPQLVWAFYQAHEQQLVGPESEFSRALSMTNLPATFWRAAPLDQLEAYVRAHSPPNAGPYVARGMERARLAEAISQRLIPAADAYVRTVSP
ncbi:MAG TPA: M1 family metallopeptidase [Candidatus Elarobacter sp.]|nr:M1 family metallopeptidase [Candidatus Elarobacter sp.]